MLKCWGANVGWLFLYSDKKKIKAIFLLCQAFPYPNEMWVVFLLHSVAVFYIQFSLIQ